MPRVAACTLAGWCALTGGCGQRTDVVPVVDFSKHASVRQIRADRQSYDFSAEEHALGLLGHGWSIPEARSDDRLTYAWAVGVEARLPFFILNRRLGWLHVRGWPHALGGGQRQMVTVDLNGTPVGTIVLLPELHEYSLQVPADALRLGENWLTFRFAYAELAADAGETGDMRRLAAAFDSVLLSGDPRPTRPPAERAESRVKAADATLEQPAGTELWFDVRVPSHGSLEFGLVSPSRGASGMVVLRHERQDRILFEGTSAGWFTKRRAIDLSDFSGQAVQLLFRAIRGVEQGGITWDRPEILGHVGPLNLATNVLLIVVDTLRTDHVGSYGGRAATPNIDALAASGVRFERAYSNIPITVPSHSSMFTSLLPTAHGVHSNFTGLSDRHVTLAELLADSYRDTAAFVSLGVLKAKAGLSQGFLEYHDDFGLDWWKRAEVMTRQILDWQAHRSAAPFFLWAHYSDPHAPYAAPAANRPRLRVEQADEISEPILADGTTTELPLTSPPGEISVRVRAVDGGPRSFRLVNIRTQDPLVPVTCRSRCQPDGVAFIVDLPATLTIRNPTDAAIQTALLFQAEEMLSLDEIRERYRAEVEYCDREIGRLLTALRSAGYLDNTLVVLTADHGEGLGDHGGFGELGHVGQLYETQLRVPLILSWPGHLPAGRTIAPPVSLVDLLPTVVDLLRLPDRQRRAGSSLVPLIRDPEGPAGARAIVAETFRPEAATDLKAVIWGDHKLIFAPQGTAPELYDLKSDPRELTNRFGPNVELVTDLGRRLEAALSAMGTEKPKHLSLDEEERQRLRALGYVR